MPLPNSQPLIRVTRKLVSVLGPVPGVCFCWTGGRDPRHRQNRDNLMKVITLKTACLRTWDKKKESTEEH